MTGVPELLAGLLAAEHAAVFGYAVLGARLPEPLRAQALRAVDAHRARRDALAARLGPGSPVAEPGYDVEVDDSPQALALAVALEEGLAARWRDLLGAAADAGDRRLGLSGLTETAVRAAHWRLAAGSPAATVAFPGTA